MVHSADTGTSKHRVPPGHGKSWNLGRPFFQAWKVMENTSGHGNVMENDDNVMEFLLLH